MIISYHYLLLTVIHYYSLFSELCNNNNILYVWLTSLCVCSTQLTQIDGEGRKGGADLAVSKYSNLHKMKEYPDYELVIYSQRGKVPG